MTDLEVEILWPSSLPSLPAEKEQDLLRGAGIDTTCMLRPTRRGAADIVLVLVTTVVMEPFLRTLFQTLAEEAHAGLKAFTERLFKPASEEASAPQCVVFEMQTGGRVTFTQGLPQQAYEQAVGLDARNDKWTWDSRNATWVPG